MTEIILIILAIVVFLLGFQFVVNIKSLKKKIDILQDGLYAAHLALDLHEKVLQHNLRFRRIEYPKWLNIHLKPPFSNKNDEAFYKTYNYREFFQNPLKLQTPDKPYKEIDKTAPFKYTSFEFDSIWNSNGKRVIEDTLNFRLMQIRGQLANHFKIHAYDERYYSFVPYYNKELTQVNIICQTLEPTEEKTIFTIVEEHKILMYKYDNPHCRPLIVNKNNYISEAAEWVIPEKKI